MIKILVMGGKIIRVAKKTYGTSRKIPGHRGSSDMVTLYSVILVCSMAVFGGIYWYGRQQATPIPAYMVVSATVLAVPAFLIPGYYLHLFDHAVWYYQYRSLEHCEYALILAAPLCAILALKFPWGRVPISIGLFLVVTLPFLKYLASPLDLTTLTHRISHGVTLQTTSSTCGPSALATLLRYYGYEHITEAELARLCHTTQTGTEVWHIQRLIRRFGIASEFVIDANRLPVYPAIAGILTSDGYGHFISVLDKHGEMYLLGDPLSGKITVDANTIMETVHFTGFYVHLFPGTHHSTSTFQEGHKKM